MDRLTRVIVTAFFFMAVFCPLSAQTNSGIRGEMDGDDGLAMFRFVSFGSGIFPYRLDAPGASSTITLQDAPFDSFSPFGADMESTPYDAGLSVSTRLHGIVIAHPDTVIDRPFTGIDFLSGPQRRSRFIAVFRRAIGDSAEIDAIGISDGLRRRDDVPGSGFRRYELSYLRLLGLKGARLRFSAAGDRDRADIADIGARKITGDRTIDNIRFSASMTGLPVRRGTVLSTVWNIRNGTTHFERNGQGDSFDDDSIHGEVRFSSPDIEKKRWEASISHDERAFAARRGGESRRYGTTSARIGDVYSIHGADVGVSGAALLSIDHGMGYDIHANVDLPSGKQTFFLRGSFAKTFPGPEHEFYSVYSFSDSSRGLGLGKFGEVSTEIGLRSSRESNGMEIAVFGGKVDMPFFMMPPVTMIMSGEQPFAGFRTAIFSERSGTTVVRTRVSFDYVALDGADCLWPRPSFRAIFRTDATRRLFKGNILANAFLHARFLKWTNGQTNPEGFGAFIDCGVTARVSSLELYYTMENVANTRTVWFDTFRTQGINAFWGVRWSLRD